MNNNERYQITAYSPSLNQSIEWFNLQELYSTNNDQQAKQQADAHAERFNQLKHMNATDWVGRYKIITVGESTLFK
jgi:hypothetical protein